MAASAALLVVAALLAYHNSFSGALVFDDLPAIRDNPTIRALWPLTTVLSPPENSGVGGRPLANLSFALNYALGGPEVRGCHVGNLLLHVGSALLLFGIVRRTLLLTVGASLADARDTALSGRRPLVGAQSCCAPEPPDVRPYNLNPTSFALTVALVWVIHPLTSSAVSYLSQRTELLMGFFYLLTLYAFIRAQEPRRRGWGLVSVGACALGMMSKEVMVTAPALVLLYDRTFVAGSFRAAWTQRRLHYVALATTWLVLGGLVATAGLDQRSVGFGLGVSPLHYALTEGRAVLLYLKLAVWPSPLVFDYGAIYAANGLATAASVGLVLALAGWTARAVARGSAMGFAAGCFFLLLAPTSSVVPVAEQPMAENRMYLPLAVVACAGVAAAHAVFGRRWRPALLLGVAALAAMTVARNRDYRSEIALWTDTVGKRPQNPRAQYSAGVALLAAGRAADAAGYFERAIQLNPREPKHHNSLGNALLELGRVPEAIHRFAEAVRLRPDHARAWYNYGTALTRNGDNAGAIERFQQALRLQPEFAEAHSNLGNIYFQQNEPARALPHYQQALRLDPTLADAHYNAGSAALELGQLAEAIRHFTAAARLKPDDAEIRNNLGAALLRAGRTAEAIAAFEHALRLKPDYGDARDNLALARAAPARAK